MSRLAMSFLTKYLGLGIEANDLAGEAAEHLGTVTELTTTRRT
jgi:hypothetical protein